jgi:hypothetical protein
LERSALVLFDSTHCYILRGQTRKHPWRFPSLAIQEGHTPYDTAVAALDMFAGSAARRRGDEALGSEFQCFPRLAALLSNALKDSRCVGQWGTTHYFTCFAPGFEAHVASFIAARYEHNGFRCTPTLRIRHPSFFIPTHDTALEHLSLDDCKALRAALGPHVAALSPRGVPPLDVSPEVVWTVEAIISTLERTFGQDGRADTAPRVDEVVDVALSCAARWEPDPVRFYQHTAVLFDRTIAMVNKHVVLDPSAVTRLLGNSRKTEADACHNGHSTNQACTDEPLEETVRPLPSSGIPDRDAASAVGTPPSLRFPSLAELREAQSAHPATAVFVDYCITGALPSDRTQAELAAFRTAVAKLYLDGEGMLRRRTTSRGEEGPIVLPPQYRHHVCHAYHDRQGHLGGNSVWQNVKRRYWWPLARTEIRTYIRLCKVCRSVKVPRHTSGRGVMHNTAGTPWADLSCDVYDVGWESGGFTKVLSFNDYFSRGVLCVPFRSDATSEDVADVIVHYLIRFYGKPLSIRSDRGSILISELLKVLYDKYGVKMCEGTAYHHETVGLTERWNSTLKALLAAHKKASGDQQWHLYLPLLELCYNASVNATTGYSPFFVMHLRHPDLPVDVLTGRPHHGRELPEYVAEHLQRLELVWSVVSRELQLQSLNRIEKTDLKREIRIEYKPGDRVLLVKGKYVDGVLPKAEEPTEGPYTILRAEKPGNYVLGDIRSRRMHDVLNEARLLPYPSRRLNTMQECADRYTVERIVDRRVFTVRGEHVLKYRLRWAGFDKSSDSWRSMDHLHEIAELVAAYNRLVPLPSDHASTVLGRAAPDTVERPPPSEAALSRSHFRALTGEASPPTPNQPPSATMLAAQFAPGTRVRMLYRPIDTQEEGDNPVWWHGAITRSEPLEPDDLSYSVRFDDPAYKKRVFGGYLFSRNTLQLEGGVAPTVPEAPGDTRSRAGAAAPEAPAPISAPRAPPRRSPRLLGSAEPVVSRAAALTTPPPSAPPFTPRLGTIDEYGEAALMRGRGRGQGRGRGRPPPSPPPSPPPPDTLSCDALAIPESTRAR